MTPRILPRSLAASTLLLCFACNEPASSSDLAGPPAPSPVTTAPAEIPVGSEFEYAPRSEEIIEEAAIPARVAPMVPPPNPEDLKAIRTTVSRYAGQAKYCYETELRADPDLEGTVELQWALSGGRAKNIRLVRDGVGSDQLVQCLVGKVGRWNFPEGLQGSVTWPFRFRPEPG